MFERKSFENLWEGRMEPFNIIGNVYFVGCFSASTHLIDTGDGLILIDPGYTNTMHLVIDGIYKLGFRPEDIQYIINTHWHHDHTQATADLAHMTGAKTLLGRDDVEKAAKFFVPDILVKDGDTLTLGNTTVSFMETPGHTKGTISFFFDTQADGKTYRVGMFGGAGANTMAQGRLDYPQAREGYRASLHRLREEHVDVFIGNHVWNNNTLEHCRPAKTSSSTTSCGASSSLSARSGWTRPSPRTTLDKAKNCHPGGMAVFCYFIFFL